MPRLIHSPLLAFFGLTYAYSWFIWLSAPWLEHYDPVAAGWYSMLAGYGPALAALTLTMYGQPERGPPGALRPRLFATGLVGLGALWVHWAQRTALSSSSQPLLAHSLWWLLVLVPTGLIWMAGSRIAGARALLAPLLHWRVAPRSYLLALLLLPVAGLSGMIVLRLLGDPWPPLPRSGPLLTVIYELCFVFVSTIITGGGLGGEVGWRGFALPRLQQRIDPLAASMVLSAAMSLWYLPLHPMTVGASSEPWIQVLALGLALRFLDSLPVAIIATWLFNRTGGNLLLLVLLYASANNTPGWWLPISAGLYLGLIVLVLGLILSGRMWQRL